MLIHRKLVALVTVLAACTAGAETAAAGDVIIRTDYTVAVTGEAFYNVARVTHTEYGDQTHHEDDQFTFRTEFPKISFWDKVGEDATISMGFATGVRGHLATVNPSGGRIDCDGSEITDFQAGRLDGQYGGGNTTYTIRVLEAVQTAMDCGSLGKYPKRFDSLGADLGSGMWDAEFAMPANAIGQDEIRVPVSRTVTGPKCPGFDEETTICELSWTAEVVFKKTGWGEESKEVEPVPIGGGPAPTPEQPVQPAKPVQPAAKPLVEAIATAAKLTSTTVSVPVSCVTGCSGTATVTLAGGKARAAAAVKPLARKKFTIAAGATKRVSIAIPKRARKAVRRAGGVRVTLAVTPKGGAKSTKRLTLKR